MSIITKLIRSRQFFCEGSQDDPGVFLIFGLLIFPMISETNNTFISNRHDEVFMENFMVILIVALACWYIVRKFWKGSKEVVSCNCGCSSCNINAVCGEEAKDKQQEF
ncbi:hypothetical protein PITCH_A1580047 [uncultured Desulfobacterium sp.]|uniref:Uncharacterized protein n=1 Tax=uncultured Desulfobacterium sp. TaxID=201089 RepID=A0A445MU05_9BACT|nr:hypothetical protein PITCH_A1580047 [uncultured Desulfobacterium sp.]